MPASRSSARPYKPKCSSSPKIPKRFWKSLRPLLFGLPTRSQIHQTGCATPKSRKSPISLLPEELVALISGHLTSRQDRLAFIKTCRAFHGPGCRTLYEHVQVSESSDGAGQILTTLLQRPDLVKHIRSYSGPLYIGPPERQPVERRLDDLETTQRRTEYHADLIRDLNITYYYPPGFGIGEQTLTLSCRMPLKKPVTSGARSDAAGEIAPRTTNHPLTPGGLPNLESLSSSVEPTKLLVPGRPVTSSMLHVNACTQGDKKLWRKLKRPCVGAGKGGDSSDGDEELCAKLAQSSAGIVNLGINPMYYYHELKRAVSYLPGIQYLCTKAHCHNINQLAQVASHFPKLEILDIGRVDEQPGLGSPQMWNDDCMGNWKHEIAVLFAKSKTLEVVSVWGRGSVILRRSGSTQP
ncbi:hypothetical protein M407DRAFT_12690 [Tulasnella calospora MUT 4182]|uniref:F-box domain-containing protein n=1 Tax=Tulasnella calospora MUT 4182 TaxID=1051891 RepID=A0A0C3Q2M3_9AGAM|nr:hypothetical protein M407DRAFT_12690 [Tulasnella calospora MUT 4182]